MIIFMLLNLFHGLFVNLYDFYVNLMFLNDLLTYVNMLIMSMDILIFM